MSGPVEASVRLQRAITSDGRREGVVASVADPSWTSWASVTFTGARHRMTLTLPDTDAATNWLAALPERELTVAGHLVADLVVSEGHRAAGDVTVTVEALTVEI